VTETRGAAGRDAAGRDAAGRDAAGRDAAGRKPAGRAGGAALLWRGGLAVLFAGIVLHLAADTVADPDLWGHLRFGRLILRLGGAPRVDPFSYLGAGHGWIDHEWLSELAFASAWDHLGTPGLVGLKAALLLALVGLVYAWLRRGGVERLRAALLALAVSLPALGNPGTVRPHLFTYLGFAATAMALSAASRGRTRWLWLLPPVFALWINLHGGVLAGVGVLGLWALGRLAVEGRRRLAGHGGPEGAAGAAGGAAGPAGGSPRPAVVLGAAAVAVAALLLNPYGARLPLFLLRTATTARPEISEWQPLRVASGTGLFYLALLVLAARTALRGPRRPPPEILLVLAATALLPLVAIRHLPLFGLSVGILLAPDFGAEAGGRTGAARGRPSGAGGGPEAEAAGGGRRRRLRAAAGVAAGLLGLAVLAASRSSFTCIPVGPPRALPQPVRAARVLEASGAGGRLAPFFDWGEYAIWHLAPRFRVGMDGRRETVYSDSVYASYLDWLDGTAGWSDYLARGPADVALVPAGSVMDNLMALDTAWTRAYDDRVAVVYARAGSRTAARIEAAPVPGDVSVDGRGACFP